MAGGLLNIISVGNNNIILTGNPSKTFFKVTFQVLDHSHFYLWLLIFGLILFNHRNSNLDC